jgi:hypothetical protein
MKGANQMTKSLPASDAREQMITKFLALGGSLTGRIQDCTFRFKPAVNDNGDLYVSIFKNGSTRQYAVMPLDEWAHWASANVSELQ